MPRESWHLLPKHSPQPPGRHPLQVAEICVEMELQDEIVPRAQNIQSRLDRQTIETEEVNKTLKATLQALLEVVASDDGDVLDSFQTSPSTESLKSTSSDPGSRQAGRRRGQQQETETFYLTKLQEYLSGRSILAKLQAKHEKLQEALQRGDKEEREMSWTQYTQRKFQKSRHPRPSSQYNQRLFGGDMEKFIQVLALPHMPAHLYMLVFLQPWVTSVTRASA
ncbi:rho GTPase-activating protein 4-like [Piliocolobus tephrosceles]|uniref:rho GTPase-activating protein 4-like n=1 Tax=Piliocolobus tephrosceles TaxID=591936 RepID=UPI000C2ADC7E|nr:rho GTPase-activating protein 4-like [Piliocolobus tephrosceles]